jgi:hypothetical protein
MSAVSGEAALNTRSLSAVAAEEDQGLDTRGFTVDWSAARAARPRKSREDRFQPQRTQRAQKSRFTLTNDDQIWFNWAIETRRSIL